MGDYRAWRGPRTGATLWRLRTGPDDVRVLPDAVMDLMWFNGRFRFAGADTTAMLSPGEDGAVTWGLRLAPGVAYSLLGIPAWEMTDRRLELEELTTIPPRIRESAYLNPAAALENLYVELWRRAEPDPAVLGLAASLDRFARAGLGVPDLAYRHEMSERTLRRLGDRVFGYGPKTLTTIHRFQHALHLARSGTSLVQASTAAGYADQSHLNRDVRRLAGTTPGDLLGRGRPIPSRRSAPRMTPSTA